MYHWQRSSGARGWGGGGGEGRLFGAEKRCEVIGQKRVRVLKGLKNCRIAGLIFLAIGDFLWMTTIIVHTRTPRKDQMLDKL